MADIIGHGRQAQAGFFHLRVARKPHQASSGERLSRGVPPPVLSSLLEVSVNAATFGVAASRWCLLMPFVYPSECKCSHCNQQELNNKHGKVNAVTS